MQFIFVGLILLIIGKEAMCGNTENCGWDTSDNEN